LLRGTKSKTPLEKDKEGDRLKQIEKALKMETSKKAPMRRAKKGGPGKK